jgi:hypothetical protein
MGVDRMSESVIIRDRIRKKEVEIQTLEERLRAAKIYVQALQDVLSAIEREAEPPSADALLRSGSSVALARESILRAGKPLHVSDLLAALGKGVTKETRASLVSSLSAYVRKREVFTRPAPNTFGLLELGHPSEPEQTLPEPPPDFGRPKVKSDEDEEIPF